MIWYISVPWWIKWRPQGQQGGLLKCDCPAPNKLHFMLHVELTSFSLHQSTFEKPQSGPALHTRLTSISDRNFNLNEHCLFPAHVIYTATNAGCPIYTANLAIVIAGKYEALCSAP